MTWIYQDKIFTEEDIGSYKGFIYLITEVDTDKKYVGQKVFWNKVSRPPLKGKKNRRISKKSSDWEVYYGSNEDLKEEVSKSNSSRYRREILHLCTSKAEMNYLESKEIFMRDALLRDDYYNKWISCRINASTLDAYALLDRKI